MKKIPLCFFLLISFSCLSGLYLQSASAESVLNWMIDEGTILKYSFHDYYSSSYGYENTRGSFIFTFDAINPNMTANFSIDFTPNLNKVGFLDMTNQNYDNFRDTELYIPLILNILEFHTQNLETDYKNSYSYFSNEDSISGIWGKHAIDITILHEVDGLTGYTKYRHRYSSKGILREYSRIDYYPWVGNEISIYSIKLINLPNSSTVLNSFTFFSMVGLGGAVFWKKNRFHSVSSK